MLFTDLTSAGVEINIHKNEGVPSVVYMFKFNSKTFTQEVSIDYITAPTLERFLSSKVIKELGVNTFI